MMNQKLEVQYVYMGGISWMNWSMNLDEGSGSEAVKSSNGEGNAGSALVPNENL
jgi:hypothetical protein